MTKDHLSIIIAGATRDSAIGDEELKLINALAHANGIAQKDVDEMIKHPQLAEPLAPTSEGERFETLYHLIQVMKIDKKVFKSEISFCEQMAEKLGYKKSVVSALSSQIYSDPSITADRRILMQKASKHLK